MSETRDEMTLERACEVMNAARHKRNTDWHVNDDVIGRAKGYRMACAGGLGWYDEWTAIAVAERLEREAAPAAPPRGAAEGDATPDPRDVRFALMSIRDAISDGCRCVELTVRGLDGVGPSTSVPVSIFRAMLAAAERPQAPTLRSQVMALAALKDGWYDGEGTAYDPKQLAAVAGLLERLAGIATASVHPNPDGRVYVEWVDRPRSDSLEIDPATLRCEWHLCNVDTDEVILGEIMPESLAEARPRVGEATREVIKFLTWVANDADPRLSVTVKFSGIKEHLGIDRINAAAAEIGGQP